MSRIREATETYVNEIIAIRRDIHRHPELGCHEVRTSALIREKLAEYGVDSIDSPVPTAVTALIHGALGPGKCVALRADIDALPLTEDTDLPFASETSCVMHACGHDMHTAMLLGAAKVLCGMRDAFSGTVKLIFQHSEDTLPGGSRALVEQGVMENPHVDAIFALHMLPDENLVGKVALRAGPMTSGVDLFDVTFTGRGGHGGEPHRTDDPLLAACQMITSLQQIVARRVDPMESAILTVGTFHSGDAVNIIPGEAKFTAVSRTFSDEVAETVRRQVFDIAKGMESISGCKVNVNLYAGYQSAFNDAGLVDIGRRAVTAELGADGLIELAHPMNFSEDFAYYGKLTGTPSAYFMLYGGHGDGGYYPLHNNKCVLREEAMPCGIRALVSIALTYLQS